ncbi:hypothetical protein OPV22_000736 [Ensete ventricosum]|uniref:Uncharacterized protein n=1 Tax=Ensete ventricosum TaxID=4639 RepID=A0AAV8RTH9_ENSVE|nr:hypothetical protein OPV22_000736 [Ensete ventricosum]
MESPVSIHSSPAAEESREAEELMVAASVEEDEWEEVNARWRGGGSLRGDPRALQHAPGAGALLLDEPEILGRAATTTTTSFLLERVIHGSVPVAPVSSP